MKSKLIRVVSSRLKHEPSGGSSRDRYVLSIFCVLAPSCRTPPPSLYPE